MGPVRYRKPRPNPCSRSRREADAGAVHLLPETALVISMRRVYDE